MHATLFRVIVLGSAFAGWRISSMPGFPGGKSAYFSSIKFTIHYLLSYCGYYPQRKRVEGPALHLAKYWQSAAISWLGKLQRLLVTLEQSSKREPNVQIHVFHLLGRNNVPWTPDHCAIPPFVSRIKKVTAVLLRLSPPWFFKEKWIHSCFGFNFFFFWPALWQYFDPWVEKG